MGRHGEMSPRDLHLTLNKFSEDGCSNACENTDLTRQVMLCFRDLRNMIISEPGIVPLHSELGNLCETIWRPKGQPKKLQIPLRVAAGLSVGRHKCHVCHAAHAVNECDYLPGIADIRR
jgi:hypothetical protein